MIPPCDVGERAEIDLMRPGRSMLLCEVEVGLRDVRGKYETIVLVAAGLAQLLESFRPQHFAQSVGRIDRC